VKFLSLYGASWKGVLLLSIILPVGLFTGLKLTGTFPTPQPETITLAPEVWQFNRTPNFTIINQSLNATYADDSAQMSFMVGLDELVPPGFAEAAYLDVGMEFTAMPLSKDFSMKGVLIYFGKDIEPSAIELLPEYMSFENLTLRSIAVSGEQAGILLLGNVSQGSGCHFFDVANWWLYTPDNATCQRQVNFEITYFNGTAYKRIVQPFNLTLLGS
jgi:hypothetical protein